MWGICYAEAQVSGETILLTAPMSLDGESDVTYRAPNLIRRIVSIFKNVRPGSDLTRFQARAPPSLIYLFNNNLILLMYEFHMLQNMKNVNHM